MRINQNFSRAAHLACGHFLKAMLLASLTLAAGLAQAFPLNLTSGSPDIASGFISTSYNAGTGLFSASGFATTYLPNGQPGPPSDAIAGGSFDITANISNAGVLSAGTLTIGGTVAAQGFNSGTLLTGTLSALGFNPAGGDPFEFLFNVTGGDAAGSFGTSGGVILNAGAGSFLGTFANSFTSAPFAGVADTFGVNGVPEPASYLLLLAGLLGIAVSRQRAKPVTGFATFSA